MRQALPFAPVMVALENVSQALDALRCEIRAADTLPATG